MTDIFQGLRPMLSIVVFAMVVVLFAMIIDLVSGINKARQRGDLRTSAGLKRTMSKFIMYEGGMLIAAGVDMLIHMSQIIELFGILSAIQGIPVVTCMVGVFLCVVEFVSVREKADQKTLKSFGEVENLAMRALSNEQLADLLTKVLDRAQQHREL